jgi:hypothetical protein
MGLGLLEKGKYYFIVFACYNNKMERAESICMSEYSYQDNLLYTSK